MKRNVDMPSFEDFAHDWLTNEKVLQMKAYLHHGTYTVYDHVCHVAKICYNLVKRGLIQTDVDSLMKIAFLHDYFLYNRFPRSKRLCHSYRHPVVAAENAKRDFGLIDKEYVDIVTHMWPQVPWLLPRDKDGWVLCLVDKVCAVKEYCSVFHRRKILINE